MKTNSERFTLNQRYGTNEGGWYADHETGKPVYVKKYANPDQSRVEVLVNSIYDHLDVPAAQSTLHTVDGKLAVVSDAVSGRGDLDTSTLIARPEVMSNFASDAYLANYDVFGLYGDNVIQDSNGIVHRIDNGGSLHFRARGKMKAFPSSDIPEIETMRDPNVIPMSDPTIAQSTAGRVYHTTTESQIREQSYALYQGLTPDDILYLISRVNFAENTRADVTNALLGRRAVLRDIYEGDRSIK